MKFKLPSGREAELFVSHDEFKLGYQRYRGTRVTFKLDGLEYTARSVCKPPDQFSKSDGRKRAANRLLDLLRNKERFPKSDLTKDDRAAIFFFVCPEHLPRRRMAKMALHRLADRLVSKVLFEQSDAKVLKSLVEVADRHINV